MPVAEGKLAGEAKPYCLMSLFSPMMVAVVATMTTLNLLGEMTDTKPLGIWCGRRMFWTLPGVVVPNKAFGKINTKLFHTRNRQTCMVLI